MEKLEVPPNGAPRERVLTDAELAAVYKTVTGGTAIFYRVVALLILTGQRKGEISHLEWSWIDDQKRTITLPSWLTKNKRTHTFPYGDVVASILEGMPRIVGNPYVFPAAREQVRGKPVTIFNGWGTPKAALGVPYSFQHIARLELAGRFPKRIQLGQCRVAWVADEVQTWVDERLAKRDLTSPS
jgi:integrase